MPSPRIPFWVSGHHIQGHVRLLEHRGAAFHLHTSHSAEATAQAAWYFLSIRPVTISRDGLISDTQGFCPGMNTLTIQITGVITGSVCTLNTSRQLAETWPAVSALESSSQHSSFCSDRFSAVKSGRVLTQRITICECSSRQARTRLPGISKEVLVHNFWYFAILLSILLLLVHGQNLKCCATAILV